MAKDGVGYKIVCIGGSAGSLEVILQIISALPHHANAAYVIIVHRKNDPDSLLESLLASKTKMKVKEVEDKEPIYLNTVYIAPPDYHLLIEDEQTFSLDSSEKILFSRPSIDVCFESIAEIFGRSCIGILLSGANADGALGLKKIKEAGGYTIVQNPKTSEVSYMPQQAINRDAATSVLDAAEIAGAINKLLAI